MRYRGVGAVYWNTPLPAAFRKSVKGTPPLIPAEKGCAKTDIDPNRNSSTGRMFLPTDGCRHGLHARRALVSFLIISLAAALRSNHEPLLRRLRDRRRA